MESTEPVKEFTKTSEVMPFNKYGLCTFEEYKKEEKEIQRLERLKTIGLTEDEIKLYNEHQAGILDQQTKIEKNVLQEKLNAIFKKISEHCDSVDISLKTDVEPSTSGDIEQNILDERQKKPVKFYPEGHPMNKINELKDQLFKHLDKDHKMPMNKRRKVMRRIERKQNELLSQAKEIITLEPKKDGGERPMSCLWDVKEYPSREVKPHSSKNVEQIGPKPRTMYSVRDNKIVRLEPNAECETGEQDYRAVDIVEPINEAEQQLLEGTKISVDDIRKMEYFKNYEPGSPSKVLYLKNLSTSVTQEQVSLLFNQFLAENEGPIDVRLMTGRMRGQAFVSFQYEHIAIQALEEINGTVLTGRPIIAEFGRNSNRINFDDDR